MGRVSGWSRAALGSRALRRLPITTHRGTKRREVLRAKLLPAISTAARLALPIDISTCYIGFRCVVRILYLDGADWSCHCRKGRMRESNLSKT
jgi:hypothetical protein